jgi:FkbM family methyltransferase
MNQFLARMKFRIGLMRGKYKDSLLDVMAREVVQIVHIGANTGQERFLYEGRQLAVIWIEPIPSIFKQLQMNVAGMKGQAAYEYLLHEHDDLEIELNISSNNGESSSILPLGEHQKIWPKVSYVGFLKLRTTRFDTMMKKECLKIVDQAALVLDTQGSELLVLRGCGTLLSQFRYVKVEAADFESYVGCCTVDQIDELMENMGFRAQQRNCFAEAPSVGRYYDILYKNINASTAMPTR